MKDLKILFRSITKNPLFSFVNIIGLSIGFIVAFVVALFVHDELNFDRFHSKSDRIYRASMHLTADNYDVHWARVNVDWINQLPEEFPEIKNLIRFQDYDPRNLKVGSDAFRIEHAYTTDPDVFEVFDFKLLSGQPKTALKAPRSIVLSQSTSQLLFGDQNPMNKTVTIQRTFGGERDDYTVTGIMEDLPSNTHMPVNALTSFNKPSDRVGWAYTYLLLDPLANVEELQAKFPGFVEKNKGDDEANYEFPLQSLNSIHLESNLAREIVPNGSWTYVYLFAGVGLFILMMSAINFINLNAAQSLKRMREIGVRKVLGSSKSRLGIQFISESIALVVLCALIALVSVFLLIDVLDPFVTLQFSVELLIALAIPLSLIIGFLAGMFPSFILSGEHTMVALKGSRSTTTRSQIKAKDILVGVQLIISITLISTALITKTQFQYLTNKNLGFSKEKVLAITNLPEQVKDNYSSFADQLRGISAVNGVGGSMEVPSREIRDAGPVIYEGMIMNADEAPVMDVQILDQDFIELMDMQIISGTPFLREKRSGLTTEQKSDPLLYLQNEPREYMINETAMRVMGWDHPEEALGKQIQWSIGTIQLQQGPIVGVVQDFHQESLRNTIEPIVMINEPYWFGNILVKMQGDNLLETVSELEQVWTSNFPDLPFEYIFLDDLFNNLYRAEGQRLELIYVFSVLAIFIAFLGIFGLMVYTLKSREKELAIRKSLGASLLSLTSLLSRRFIIISSLGLLIAVPLIVIGMEGWLSNFAYRIEIPVSSFLIATVIVLAVLLTTVGIQVRKTNSRNIFDSLRSE